MIPLDKPPGIPTIIVLVDVISAGCPGLMGMDILHQHSFTPSTVTNQLIKRTIVDKGDKYYAIYDCHIPLKRSDGHLYAQ